MYTHTHTHTHTNTVDKSKFNEVLRFNLHEDKVENLYYFHHSYNVTI